MASALDKVTNFMLPDLQGNNMANLLGIDTVRKARGRALLDAGLTGMAMAGPRPATDNVNSAMILKNMFDQGYNTYDNAINREMSQLQTNMALQDQIQKKTTFNSLLASDYITEDEKAFALTLGAEDGSKFLSDVYMKKLDLSKKTPTVKKMELVDANGNGTGELQYVPVAKILENQSLYKVPDETGTFAKNMKDFENILGRELTMEEKTQYINSKLSGQSVVVESDGQGGFKISYGTGGNTGMEKATTKNLEQQIINNAVNYEGFKEIASLYRPEFSELDTRLKIKWAKFKEAGGDWSKLLGLEVSEEEKQLINDYSKWEQKSWEMTNQYIKSITGAQMSEAEAQRILKGFADPRKLSPTEYKAKLEGILDNAMKSTIRYNLILRSGLNIPTDANGNLDPEKVMSLASVDSYVNNIGNELKAELRANPDFEFASDEEIDAEVKKQLKVLMFGDTSQNVFTLENIR